MPKLSAPSFLIFLVCAVLLAPCGGAAAEVSEESVSALLIEVGQRVALQIELAQTNFERGTLDSKTIERQADAASREIRNLERLIHAIPEASRGDLLAKLQAIQGQAANLVRAAELETAPPRRPSGGERVAHLERRFEGSRQPPSNDDCENAFVVGLGSYAGETNDATNDGEAVCGASLNSPDVWYRFVAPEHGHVIAEATYSMYDTVLSVHSECPGTMTNQIVCNDDTVGVTARVQFQVWQGHEYLVRVSGSNGASGIYQIAFSYGGAIEGAVTDTQTGTPESTYLWAFDGDGYTVAGAPTDAAGIYSVDGLGTGEYFVATDGDGETVDEVWDDHACPGGPFNGCDPTTGGDQVAVTIGTVTGGIDFVLDRNGVITGTVTDEDTGLGIDNARIELYDAAGGRIEWEYTDTSGDYRFTGLEPGSTYLWATATTHLDELYDDVLCPGGPNQSCVVADGTPVVVGINSTSSGIDFQLERLGAIAGTVVDRTTALPISYSDVDVWDQNGSWVKDDHSAQDGTYEIGGLPDGSYFVTASKYSGYIRQLYDGIDCPPEGCAFLTGTPVVVAGQTTTSGIDFDLIEKGRIEGQVLDQGIGSPVQGVRVRVYDDAGEYVGRDNTNSLGSYVVGEIDAGTYYLIADDEDYYDELYDDLPCPDECDPTTGTPVIVTAGTAATGIDFSMVAGGIITGEVIGEGSGLPLDMDMLLYDQAGALVRSVGSQYGFYRFSGLDDGQYFVVVSQGYYSDPYLGELYDDIPCWGGPPEGCTATDGVLVSASSGSTTSGIDFSLLRAGSIQGVIADSVTQDPVGGGSVMVRRVSPPDSWSDWDYPGSDGVYGFDGLLPGEYVVAINVHEHRDEVWNDLPCQAEFPDGCDLLGGTPISITSGSDVEDIDFAVDRLGEVNGTVRSASSGLPLPGTRVMIFDDQGQYLVDVSADPRGDYRYDRLWPGTYFAATNDHNQGFVDQLYQGIECPQGPFDGCDPATGAPLAVGFNTSTRWVDFDLAVTGAINGRVTDEETSLPLVGVRVRAWDDSGNERSYDSTDIEGAYSLVGLESGTFFVATEEFGTHDPDYIDQLYEGIPCPSGPPWGCDPTKGTPVVVVGGTTTENVDLALARRLGGIAGMVSGLPGGDPLEGVQIDVWSATWGDYEGGALTSPAGTYLIDLDPGDYLVATDNPGAWTNQIWDGIVCPDGSAYNGDCDAMTGDVITVIHGELTEGIDFVLAPTFAVFADGFESGTTILWSATTP